MACRRPALGVHNKAVMAKMRIGLLLLALALALSTTACRPGPDYAFESLEFPIQTPSDIGRLASFGIPNWSGLDPHNGIDLVLRRDVAQALIVSPVHGTISGIEAKDNSYSNPPNQMMLTVDVYVNSEFTVHLVVEPSTTDPIIKKAVLDELKVKVGQEVHVGDPIVELIAGEHGYPHLHLWLDYYGDAVCAYSYSSRLSQRVFEKVAAVSTSTGMPDGRICFGE